MTPEEAKLLAAKQRMSPVMETPKSSSLKRKRAESSGSDASRHGRSPTKLRMDKDPQVVIQKLNRAPNAGISVALNGNLATSTPPLSPTQPDSRSNDATNGVQQDSKDPDAKAQGLTLGGSGTRPIDGDMATHNMSSTDRQYADGETKQIRQTIEAQLGLEILLKHNELRLIDQEIAKCQVALEQLRRCHEIPYPMTSVSPDVNSGTGPALRQARGAPSILSPASWGTADGPYTRHYARWLIPDQRFDGEVESPMEQRAVAAKLPSKGRGLRGGPVDLAPGVTSSRGHRGSTGSKLQSLSSGYAQPRDKAGPMIQKRKSDGQVVKLVCLDCRRDNFSSAQGFINHCRIAHSRNFASHDAAADACGEPVEVDDAGALIGGNNEPPSTATAGIVHPLIRSAHLIKPTPVTSEKPNLAEQNALKPAADVTTPRHGKDQPNGRPASSLSPNPSFIPSPDTPNLSALLQSRGFGLDLKNLLADTRSHIDVVETSSDDESEGEIADVSMTHAHTPSGHLTIQGGHLAARQPARATMSPAPLDRPNSRKGLEKPKQKPRLMEPVNVSQPPLYPSSFATPDHRMRESSPPNLSPDTVESNQAPSLVSDDGDYEAHSESESSPSSAGGEDEGGDFNVEVEEYESATTNGTTTDADLAGPPKEHHAVRRASAFRRSVGDREEKHVSFVSPNLAPADLPSPKKGGGRRKGKG